MNEDRVPLVSTVCGAVAFGLSADHVSVDCVYRGETISFAFPSHAIVPITLLSPERLCATSCFGFSRGGFLLFVCPSSVGVPLDFHVWVSFVKSTLLFRNCAQSPPSSITPYENIEYGRINILYNNGYIYIYIDIYISETILSIPGTEPSLLVLRGPHQPS